MRVLQIGNFEPPHSTENELRDALLRLGVDLATFQEGDPLRWERAIHYINHGDADMVLWTSTRSLAERVPEQVQYDLLRAALDGGVPTVGYHLDRWWGLHANRRQEQMFGPDGALRPFFNVQYLFTADGGHQEQWAEIGVNHIWMPPAISERWCYLAEPDPKYDFDIVFVGGWHQYGHTEWTHREEMIAKVRDWYGHRFRCLPKKGQPRITMGDLNTIYASAKVVLGDSCLVPKADGSPMTHYCSDRIPETLGRGGVLVHPTVDGVHWMHDGPFSYNGWSLGNWDELHSLLDEILAWDSDSALDERLEAIKHIKDAHTYTHRMRDVIDTVTGVRL